MGVVASRRGARGRKKDNGVYVPLVCFMWVTLIVEHQSLCGWVRGERRGKT